MPRALKVFSTDQANHRTPLALIALTGRPRHRTDVNVYVVAPIKELAIARLAELGINVGPADLRVNTSTPVRQVKEAGLLVHEGDVVAYQGAQHSNPIARSQPGSRSADLVGTWVCDRTTDYQLAIDEV